MKSVFLGERKAGGKALSMGASNAQSPPDERMTEDTMKEYFDNYFDRNNPGRMHQWLEIWDYVGGCSFRGFIAGSGEQKCLFVFFDAAVIGRDLKQGLMALIELAGTAFDCPQMVVCVDRGVDAAESTALLKSLRWVGFELVNLDMWSRKKAEISSRKWLFLGMEL